MGNVELKQNRKQLNTTVLPLLLAKKIFIFGGTFTKVDTSFNGLSALVALKFFFLQ
jgi:hypothetical protein